MGLVTRSRPKIGDVVEISTPKGFAYAQFIHKHDRPPKYGALLRILPGTFPTRPNTFEEIVIEKEIFLVFFPLGAACARGIVKVVSEEQIPEWSKPFPTFRCGVADSAGQVAVWYLWDGEKEWRVGTLSPEQKKLPVKLGVWNDTLLIQRIVEGWKPPE